MSTVENPNHIFQYGRKFHQKKEDIPKMENSRCFNKLAMSIVSSLVYNGNISNLKNNPGTILTSSAGDSSDSAAKASLVYGSDLRNISFTDIDINELKKMKDFVIEGIMKTVSDPMFRKEMSRREIIILDSEDQKFLMGSSENINCHKWDLKTLLDKHILPIEGKEIRVKPRIKRGAMMRKGKRQRYLQGLKEGKTFGQMAREVRISQADGAVIKLKYELTPEGNAVPKIKK
jgi:hypothetical protein